MIEKGTLYARNTKFRDFVYRVPVIRPLLIPPEDGFGKMLYEAETQILRPIYEEVIDYLYKEYEDFQKGITICHTWLLPNKHTQAKYSFLVGETLKTISYPTTPEEVEFIIKGVIYGR